MKALTVKQLAALSGVTVRALHHYDEIGLLAPAYVGENGYRYYERPQMLRLQQILFHRELGVPLADIAALLELEAGDQAGLLLRHRKKLEAERERYRLLIETIDRTLADIRGQTPMTNADLYRGFSPDKQAAYEAWLVDRYGGDMPERIADSHRAYASLSEAEQQARMDDLRDLEEALAEGCRRGVAPDAAAVDPLLARHRDWVAAMWARPCPPAAYAGLADMYLAHPDFRTRYETIAPGFTDWLVAAMKAHAARG